MWSVAYPSLVAADPVLQRTAQAEMAPDAPVQPSAPETAVTKRHRRPPRKASGRAATAQGERAKDAASNKDIAPVTVAAPAAPPAPPDVTQQNAQAAQEPKPLAGAPAQPATSGPSGAAPQPAAPQSAARNTGEFQPVQHAQKAKITTCMDAIVSASATVIDSTHTALSTWAPDAPDAHLFESILGLDYPNSGAPNAAAVIVAAPTAPNKCEAVTVQILPTAQPCGAVQAALIKAGRTIGTLRNLPVVETTSGFRDVLLPSAGGGCVVVAVARR